MLLQPARSYLVTEAWRAIEEARGTPERDHDLERLARSAGPALESRIAYRAARLAARVDVDGEVDRLGRRLALGALIVFVLAFLFGFGAARVLPEDVPARANAVGLLGALLVPHAIALLLWLLISLASLVGRRRVASGGLGRLPGVLFDFARGDPGRASPRSAARRAWLDYLADTAGGRARVAVVTHGAWLMFLCGALLACWWLLAVRQIDFYWGSTLLDARTVERALLALAEPLDALGFVVPQRADIAASRLGAPAPPAMVRQRWGLMVLGALFVYGLLPRAATLLLTLVLLAVFDRRLRLALDRPGYARLLPLLRDRPRQAVIEPDDAAARLAPTIEARLVPRTPPPRAAWLSLERDLPAPADAARDLGTIGTRAAQEAVLAALAGADARWPAVVIQAALDMTPDRGLAHFIGRVRAAARTPVYAAFRETAAAAAWTTAERDAREADWHRLAVAAGIDPARICLLPHAAPAHD